MGDKHLVAIYIFLMWAYDLIFQFPGIPTNESIDGAAAVQLNENTVWVTGGGGDDGSKSTYFLQ